MSRYHKKIILITLLLGLSLISMACSSNDTSDPSERTEIRVGITGDPVSFDPQNATDSVARNIFNQIFDNLVTLDEDMEVVPELAKEWESSDDGTEWTFILEEDVVFQDGEPFNAEAVKINFERLSDKDNNLAMYPDIGQNIESIEAKDDVTVIFNLKEPKYSFLRDLTAPANGIMSPKSIESKEREEISKEPVGAGPYKLKDWNPGDSVELEAHADYWRGEPEFETVTFKVVQENSSRITMLSNDEIDLASTIPYTEVDRIKNDDNLAVDEVKQNRILYTGINSDVEPLDDIRVRQALNYAINKEELANQLLDGNVSPATAAITDLTFGHTPLDNYPYDLEKAKQLLEEAGIEKGQTLRLILASNVTEDVPAAEFVQNSLEQLEYFDIKLEKQELGTYLETLTNPDSYELFMRGIVNSVGDPDRALREEFLPDSQQNYSNYSNPDLTELLESASSEMDEKKREEQYADALKIINDEAARIPLYEDMYYWGKHKNLEGIIYKPRLNLRHAKFSSE